MDKKAKEFKAKLQEILIKEEFETLNHEELKEVRKERRRLVKEFHTYTNFKFYIKKS